jgi:hypothetical protein
MAVLLGEVDRMVSLSPFTRNKEENQRNLSTQVRLKGWETRGPPTITYQTVRGLLAIRSQMMQNLLTASETLGQQMVSLVHWMCKTMACFKYKANIAPNYLGLWNFKTGSL